MQGHQSDSRQPPSVVHILDRIGTRANENGVSPIQIWKGNVSSVKHLRVFGCRVYVHREVGWKKLDPKARKGIFLGYDDSSRSYVVLMDDTNKCEYSRSVDFDESVFPFRGGQI